MAPKILIEPSTLPIEVQVFARGDAPAADALRVADAVGRDVDFIVILDVSGSRIRYELEDQPVGLCDLTVMFVPETAKLFLGGRRSSCVVDLASMTVEHRFEHCLFWAFDRDTHPGFVLETGELDCLFRRLDGSIAGAVPVDPPWECVVEPGGVRFESTCHGSQLLALPDAG